MTQRDVRLPAPKPFLDRPEAPKGILTPDTFMKTVGAVLFVGAAILPFITATPYVISILTSAFIYIVLAMGLNVVVGYAGLLDLGYVAFMAVGAYTSGILTTQFGLSMLETMPFVILACIISGIIIGGPTLRLRSDYLAIVTLGFGEIIRITANNLKVTGGPSGIHGIPNWSFFGWSFSDGLEIFGIRLTESILFYYFVLFIGIGCAVVMAARLGRGKLGRAWKSVRDDEDVSEAMGINGYATKLMAYIIGAIWGGFAGTLMGAHLSAISPNSFQFLYSALVLMAVVLGGMGSTPGIIIGALFVSLAPEFLREFSDWRFLLFGLLLVIAMIFRPRGIWPENAVLPFLKQRKVREIPPTRVAPVVGVEADDEASEHERSER